MVVHLNDQLEFFPSTSIPDWINISLFVLCVVPTNTNPLLYVVSDPKYRRYTSSKFKQIRIKALIFNLSGPLKKLPFALVGRAEEAGTSPSQVLRLHVQDNNYHKEIFRKDIIATS